MKNSSDTKWNRNRSLPVCSAVSQPTAPPRAPKSNKIQKHIREEIFGSFVAQCKLHVHPASLRTPRLAGKETLLVFLTIRGEFFFFCLSINT